MHLFSPQIRDLDLLVTKILAVSNRISNRFKPVNYPVMPDYPKLMKWLECAALVPVTFILVPFMLYGMLGLAIALTGVWHKPWGMAAALPILLMITEMLAGCASLACAWFLALRGVERVRRIQRSRFLAIGLLVVGLTDALHFLLSDPKVTTELLSSTSSILMWPVLLVLPMLVGGRYLVLLLATTPPAQP